jgi:hypothetical protein
MVLWRTMMWGLAAVAVAVPVAAQERPRVELSGGYQLVNFNPSQSLTSLTLARGWFVDAAGSVNHVVSLVAEVGGGYKSQHRENLGFDARVNLNMHEFMGGVRLNARQARVVSFGQFLLGGVHGRSSSSVSGALIHLANRGSATHFAMQADGGVIVPLTGRVGVRIGAGYLRVQPKNEETIDGGAFRFVAGLALPLGRK